MLRRYKSDETLMLAYQRGDGKAFSVLYSRNKDGLTTYLWHSYARQDVVEDIAQDTWESVIKSANQYSQKSTFKTWLYSIARNRLIDWWRKQDNQNGPLDDHQEALVVEGHDPDARIQDLMVLVARLPQEQKDALLLKNQGFSQLEIAEITGSEPETVKTRIRYARDKLRVMREEECG